MIKDNSFFYISKLKGIQEPLDLNYIKKQIEEQDKLNAQKKFDYLYSLLHPESSKGCRLPSSVSIGCTTYQLNGEFIDEAPSSIDDCWALNPFFLSSTDCIGEPIVPKKEYSDEGQYYPPFTIPNRETCPGTFWRNQTRETTKDGDVAFFQRPIGQCINSIYDRYRLVSASLTVTSISNMYRKSGVIWGGISFTSSDVIGMRPDNINDEQMSSPNPDFKDVYHNDKNLDGYREVNNWEGLRFLYYPIDPSMEEFVNVFGAKELSLLDTEKISYYTTSTFYRAVFRCPYKNIYKGKFFWFLRQKETQNVGNVSLKFNLCANFECIPKIDFMKYIRLDKSTCTTLSEFKKIQIFEQVRKASVMKNK